MSKEQMTTLANWGKLPLKAAYPFLRANGLGREAEIIRTTQVEVRSYTSSVRRGMVIDVLQDNGLLDVFISTEWPHGSTQGGRTKIKHYLDLLREFRTNVTAEGAADRSRSIQATKPPSLMGGMNPPVPREERKPHVVDALRQNPNATIGELFDVLTGSDPELFRTPRDVKNTLHHYASDWPDSSAEVLFERVTPTRWRLRGAATSHEDPTMMDEMTDDSTHASDLESGSPRAEDVRVAQRPGYRPWTQDEEDELRRLVQSEESLSGISAILSRPSESIRIHINLLRITRRSQERGPAQTAEDGTIPEHARSVRDEVSGADSAAIQAREGAQRQEAPPGKEPASPQTCEHSAQQGRTELIVRAAREPHPRA